MILCHKILNILLESPFSGNARPHVFCDIDGVLANFSKGLEQSLGVSEANIDEFLLQQGGWEYIANNHPHLFAKLPTLPDARGLVSGLVSYRDAGAIRLSFLTAIPTQWYEDAQLRKSSTQDKITWVTRHFQKIPAASVLVVRRRDKRLAAKKEIRNGAPPPVLIDDFKKNIREWEQEGGLGVHHESGLKSLQALHNYLE